MVKVKHIKSIIIFICLLIVLSTQNKVSAISSWPWGTQLVNNGSSASSSNNGITQSYGQWGASSVIWPHKADNNPSDKFWFAKERSIYLPRGVSWNEDVSIDFWAAGYAKYLLGSATDDTHVNVKVYYQLENSSMWLPFKDDYLSGYHNDSRGALSPHYEHFLDWHIQGEQLPMNKVIRAFKIQVINTLTNPSEYDLYCIDVFSLSVSDASNPILNWAVPTNENTDHSYHNNSTNKYWYKKDTQVTVDHTFHDDKVPLMSLYSGIRLKNSDGTETNMINIGNDVGGNTSWNDYINTSYISNTSSGYVAGDNYQRQTQFRFTPKVEGDYSYYAYAVNNTGRWQLPSKQQSQPIDTNTVIGVDGTGPVAKNGVTMTNKALDSFTINLCGLKDLQQNGADGSGFWSANVAVWPDAQAQYPSMWNDADVNGTTNNASDLAYNSTTGDMSFKIKYAPEYAGIYGKYNVHVYLYDRVGNASVLTFTIDRNSAIPINPGLVVEKYKYMTSDGTYWVNATEDFSVKTFVQSQAAYGIAPNQTILLAGNSDSYNSGTNYTGFSSIVTETATVKSSDITKSTENGTYINKFLDYRGLVNGVTLTASHQLKANATNNSSAIRKYNLYTLGRTYDTGQGKWVTSDVYNSGKKLSIDAIDPTGTFTPNSMSWTNAGVLIKFDPSDGDGSGVKRWRYRISKDGIFDTEGWQPYVFGDITGDIALNSEGQWKIQAEIVDNVDNVGYVTSGTYQIDLTDPSGNFTPNSKTWTNTSVPISFDPSDLGGSGVKEWKYRVSKDGSFDTEYWSTTINGDTASNINISGEGQWQIQVSITDIAGNTNTILSGIYQIDLTKPSGIYTPNSKSWTNTNVSLTFNPSDAGGSGVRQWRFRASKDNTFDTETWCGYIPGDVTGNIVISNEGQWKLQAEIFDNAGNVNYVYSGIYEVDFTKPILSGNLSYGWTKDDVTVSLNATDALSGMKSIELYNNSNAKLASGVNSLTYKDTTSGIERYKISSSDIAGNIAENYAVVKIDRTAPNGTVTPTYDNITFDLGLNVTKITENESGVDEIWAEYSNNGDPATLKKQVLQSADIFNREDFNSDGIVNNADLTLINSVNNVSFGSTYWNAKYDLNYDGEINNSDIAMVNAKMGTEYTCSGSTNLLDMIGESKTVLVTVKAKDLVGNERILYQNTYNVSLTPKEASVNITNAKYVDDNINWVNTREPFNITTKVKTEDYPVYPANTILYMSGNGLHTSPYIGTSSIATISSYSFDNGTEKETMFAPFMLNPNAIQIQSGTSLWLQELYTLKANYLANGKKLNLYTDGSVVYKGKNIYSAMGTTSQILAVDGDAPTYASHEIVNKTEDTFTVRVQGVSDNNLSGLKSVMAEAWVEGNDSTRSIAVTKISEGIYEFVVNRNDFNGVRRGYNYKITLEDNVGNKSYVSPSSLVNMLQYNLTANKIRIYDARDNRYVTQVISGMSYQAVIDYSNTGEIDINSAYNIGLTLDGIYNSSVSGQPIRVDETKQVIVDFIAGEEDLDGVVYRGVVDYNNVVDESNEDDNVCKTAEPYDTPRSDINPPIPPSPSGEVEDIPIITIVVDLQAKYVNVINIKNTASEFDTIVDELLEGDNYMIKFEVTNNSSLNIKYLDLLNKDVVAEDYYDGVVNGTHMTNDIDKGKSITYYDTLTVPLLPDGTVETVKPVTGIVDVGNKIRENNETNNTISINKKVLGLKVTDYRITDMVNPIKTYNYPIYIVGMPAEVKAGYNVTFRCNVKGKPNEVTSC